MEKIKSKSKKESSITINTAITYSIVSLILIALILFI
jgi:hypothetical protein